MIVKHISSLFCRQTHFLLISIKIRGLRIDKVWRSPTVSQKSTIVPIVATTTTTSSCRKPLELDCYEDSHSCNLEGWCKQSTGWEQRPSRHVDVQGRNQGPFWQPRTLSSHWSPWVFHSLNPWWSVAHDKVGMFFDQNMLDYSSQSCTQSLSLFITCLQPRLTTAIIIYTTDIHTLCLQ